MKCKSTMFVLVLSLLFANSAKSNDIPVKPEPVSPVPSGLVHKGFFRPLLDVVILKNKSESSLALAQGITLIADGAATTANMRSCSFCTELDPVSRTFIGARPTWKSMAGPGIAQEVVGIYLAAKMRNSSHKLIRKTWWIPQALGISANVVGATYSLYSPRVIISTTGPQALVHRGKL